jgi:hypothetical protein
MDNQIHVGDTYRVGTALMAVTIPRNLALSSTHASVVTMSCPSIWKASEPGSISPLSNQALSLLEMASS